jgi:hypothetical protein
MLGTFGILFCSYRLYLRDKYFIDRKNKTLHTITLMKKLDKKVKDTAIYMLREHVLKDEATINMTAKHLLKLVYSSLHYQQRIFSHNQSTQSSIYII